MRVWHTPVLLTVQGDFTIERNIVLRYPSTIRKATVITTSSQYIKDKVPLPPDTTVIPNAVSMERFKPTKHGTRYKLNLVTVMNFYFWNKCRGVIDIIDALRRSSTANFRYVVVGDGPYRRDVEKHAASSGLDIIFCGQLEDTSLVLSYSDLFLYCTYQDSFPNVLVEAMSSKLPVLVNSWGGMGGIVNHGEDGLIAVNMDEYSKYLDMLLADTAYRSRLGEQARCSVERKYSWSVVAKRFMDIYERILDER